MAAVYNYVTLAQAQQELANRLYDPSSQFWTLPELLAYLSESLQTWNALTSTWRGDFTWNTVPGAQWLDLTTVPGTLRPQTLTDTSLYPVIQYHLLEPAIGVNPWTGASLQFSADDLVQSLARRRDEILSITGCQVTRRLVPALLRNPLPDTVIDVRRNSYLPTIIGTGYGTGLYGVGGYGGLPPIGGPANSILWPEDSWAESAFNRNYAIAPPGVPSVYMLSTQPPITFDVDATPVFPGQFGLLTIEAGPATSIGTPTPLSIPDDWAWVLKWGILADLLSRESNARDPFRASYCEQRYRQGVMALDSAAALLAFRVNGNAVQVDSVRGADLYKTTWEADAPGTPYEVLTAGLNTIALNPAPSSALISLAATVVANAPLPSAPTDPMQVSRDDLDVVLGYAQHLAAFKQGGAEFLSTAPLFSRFMKQAQLYNDKLAEVAEFTKTILEMSQREADMNPRMAPAEAAS